MNDNIRLKVEDPCLTRYITYGENFLQKNGPFSLVN